MINAILVIRYAINVVDHRLLNAKNALNPISILIHRRHANWSAEKDTSKYSSNFSAKNVMSIALVAKEIHLTVLLVRVIINLNMR
jgi:hypothetical protein